MSTNEKENRCLAKGDGQTIAQHTEKLLSQFSLLQSLSYVHFDEFNSSLIEFVAKYHDVGKINSRFQNKIMKAMGTNNSIGKELDELYKRYNIVEIPHGIISAVAIDFSKLSDTFGKDMAKIILTVIANHHTRTAVNERGEMVSGMALMDIAEDELKLYGKYISDDLPINRHNIDRLLVSPNATLSKIIDEKTWESFAYLKGMLNKLDYSASANCDCEIESVNAAEYVENYFLKKNFTFNDCQLFMKNHTTENVIIIASTGIGKTEAALLWQKNDKTFYTLPLKVAINAIFERIQENYYDKDLVKYLHSDTLSDMFKEDNGESVDEKFRKYSMIKSLSAPFTICTVDQLFTFVMKSLGTEILAATLSYSKVIIDEIQAYSPQILAYLIFGLSVITRLGGHFCIMTATLPPVIPMLLRENGVEFVSPNNAFLKKSDKTGNTIIRHNLLIKECDLDYDLIASQGEKYKVLVIANTVFKAQEVFDELKELTNNVNLIHARFTAEDRRKKEDEIQKFAKGNEPGIWVSTQIVEASLDIDFDILHTEMSTADSLLQRLGRCYRNRDYGKNTPNCFVYINNNGRNSVYDKDIYDRSVSYLVEAGVGIFEEEKKVEYVNNVFDVVALKGSYVKKIRDAIKQLYDLIPDYIKKKYAEDKFRDIKNVNLLTQEAYQALKNSGVIETYQNSKSYLERNLAQQKMRDNSISMAIKTVKYSKNANIITSDIGIIGYLLTDNLYSYEKGLTNEIDDEIGFN